MPLPWLRLLRCMPFAAMAATAAIAAPATVTIRPAQASLVLPVQGGCQMAGPFATMRRANEVAEEARRRGYNAIAFHNGDGYYVRAC